MTRHTLRFASALLSTLFLVSCGTVSGPSDGSLPGGGSACATDFSCPVGEECGGGGCVPVATAIYDHIQTASALFRSYIDDSEVAWRAAHFDLLIGQIRADEIRAINPNARLFEYTNPRYFRDDAYEYQAALWAQSNGYDAEDIYLHYREDIVAPGWESKVIVEGYPAGEVPGWNPGGGSASATNRSQSRVVSHNFGQAKPYYLANTESPMLRGFLVDHITRLMDGSFHGSPHTTGPVDGILIDNSIFYPQFGEGVLSKSDEYFGLAMNNDHPYAVAFETLYPELAIALGTRFARTIDVMPNYGHVLFLDYANRVAENVQKTTPWIWGEVWLSYRGTSLPTSGSQRCITYEKDYDKAIRNIVDETRAGARRVIGANDYAGSGAGSARGRLLTLGVYYLVHNANTFYMYETDGLHINTGRIKDWAWNPAVAFNVGTPVVNAPGIVDYKGNTGTSEHYVFASGSDPHAPTLTYRVLAREFSNALVLVKLLPEGSRIDDLSITTHGLDGTHLPLLEDGTAGAPVTEATLRNNEALILIKSN